MKRELVLDKELALAFDFENAPEEVKVAAQAHRESWLRFKVACSQCTKWASERTTAEISYDETAKAFRKALNEWDPAGTNTSEAEELP
jgi:hypothetical protein